MAKRTKPFIIDDETIHDAAVKDAVYYPTVDGERKGHGYVPRDYRLYPESMFAPPSDIPIRPRSDWSDLLKELKAGKALLSDIRLTGDNGKAIPSLDQNGQGYSHTKDTEVLTESGWVLWPDYNWKDKLGSVNPLTHRLEFQSPTEGHAYRYTDEIYYSTNRRVDFGVTRNHRMLVRKWDERARTLSNKYVFQRADKLGWYTGLMHAPRECLGVELEEVAVEGDLRKYSGDDFVALLSVIISCGYAGGSDSTKNQVSFCCFDPERYEKYALLARRVGFNEQPTRKGVWTRYGAGALAEWVRNNCYVGNRPYRAEYKKLPDIVRCASTRQIRLFLEWFGDQTHGAETPQFWSSSKTLIDDLQILHLRIGKRGVVDKNDPQTATIKSGYNEGRVVNSKESYTLTIGREDRLCLDRKKHIETDHYDDLVYCATVPNGTLVTRRNGTVLVSGNCWAYSTGSAITVVRALNHAPYVRLSPHAVACKIKNFRDEGGWCGLSAEFARTKGYPTVRTWPEKSMSRANDKPEVWTEAALSIVTEDFCDLTRAVYDQNLNFDQVASCLLMGIPCMVDFNWWSHSVCALDLVEVEPGSFGLLIWNSWSDSWGTQGMGVLRGSQAIPNGAVAIRVAGSMAA